jgi:hypothetical protein
MRNKRLIIKKIDLKLESDNEHSILCSECKMFGYCTKYYYLDEKTNQLQPIENNSIYKEPISHINSNGLLGKNEISELVNLRTEIKEGNTGLVRKIQNAHDLFHQDEFEQASYLYQDIVATRSDIQEAWRGLLACFYFLGKYDEAISLSMYNILRIDSSFIDKLVNTCEYLLNEENDLKENTYLNDSNSFSDAGVSYVSI